MAHASAVMRRAVSKATQSRETTHRRCGLIPGSKGSGRCG
jgi:hypothetical protein